MGSSLVRLRQDVKRRAGDGARTVSTLEFQDSVPGPSPTRQM
jgi:hypothetical protein